MSGGPQSSVTAHRAGPGKGADSGSWHRIQGSAVSEAWKRRTRRIGSRSGSNLAIHLSMGAWFATGITGQPDTRLLALAGTLFSIRVLREAFANTPVPWVLLTLRAAAQARKGRGNLAFAAVQLNLNCEHSRQRGAQAALVRALTRLYLSGWDHDPEKTLELLGDGNPTDCCRTHSIPPVDCSMTASRTIPHLQEDSIRLLKDLVREMQQRPKAPEERCIDPIVERLQATEAEQTARTWRRIHRRLMGSWEGSLADLAAACDALTSQERQEKHSQDHPSSEKNRDTARS